MKPFILINDYGGYAFIVELAVTLAERGYRVMHVFTSSSGSPTGQIPNKIEHFNSINIDMPRVQKANFYQRWKSERLYGKRVAALVQKHKPNVVLSANTPLEAQRKIQHACRSINCRFIFWLQDFLSLAAQSVLSKKMGFPGYLVGCYFHQLEKKLLRHSDLIIGITDAFTAILKNWRINNKVVFIPNWAPLEHVPVRDKVNEFSLEYNLAEKLVVLYSGTMGMKQNPHIVVKAAEELRNNPNIIFVVISDGVGMQYLRQRKIEKHLENLVLLPLQPFERLPDILATADLGLVLLDADAGTYCVPSKVWSLYCAARPVLMVVPENNLAAQVTKEQNAGIVIDPKNADKLAATILELREQPEKRKAMGANGRTYAEANFQIEKIADQFESLLNV